LAADEDWQVVLEQQRFGDVEAEMRDARLRFPPLLSFENSLYYLEITL
jgi:hypothetical protein